MSTGYVIPLDPAELASRFSSHYDPPEEGETEGDLCCCYNEEEDISIEDMQNYFADSEDIESKIEPLLERIPVREADLILMYYVQGKRQADIADIFGVTQAAISYRLDRGLKRIKFLLSIPQVTKEDLQRDLPLVFPSQKDGSNIDVGILVGMWETTCQSEVATRMSLTQGRVRHRFFKAVKVLEDAAQKDKKFEKYRLIFSSISSKHFNILREVRLPQWSDRGGDSCF
jgi:hypothetical protein